jgi:hypothetical protein
MANESEIPNPDFRIWFPHMELSGDEIRCSFDAVKAGAVLLHEGTEEMSRAFLERIGIAVHTIRGWCVERICTPFFTDLPDASDWRDRYRVSWYVTIRATVAGPMPDLGAEPSGVIAIDATARVGRPDRTPGNEVCEVLAVEVNERGSGSSGALSERLQQHFPDHSVTVQEAGDRHRVARIGRIRVGRLPVGEALERLDAVKDTCAELGLATTIPSFELHRARVR